MANKSVILLLDCYSIILILTYSVWGTCYAFHEGNQGGENNSIDWFPQPTEEMAAKGHNESPQHRKITGNILDASQMAGSEQLPQPSMPPSNDLNIRVETTQATVPIASTNQNTDKPEEVGGEVTPSSVGPPKECQDDNYCLNGGTCILTETGQMMCLCRESFYGARCQTKNICKTIIADLMTGDQICAKIDRECFMTDKFFRCSCHQDEYFVFKNHLKGSNYDRSNKKKRQKSEKKSEQSTFPDTITSSYNFENMLDDDDDTSKKDTKFEMKKSSPTTYLAECRKINKCLGVRCRQMSEICQEGLCVCNQDAGYIKDPLDGLCKLLDPCKMPSADGEPICGQAQCVATYDHELYRCLCPVGYRAIKVGSSKSSTQCALLTDTICDVPLLNNCQHICRIDRVSNNYKCSCLPGYKAGKHPGIDDHLCFFDEHMDHSKYIEENLELGRSTSFSESSKNEAREYVYKTYLVPKQTNKRTDDKVVDNTITYDPLTTTKKVEEAVTVKIMGNDQIDLNSLKTHETLIKRELRNSRDNPKDNFIWSGRNNDSSSNYGGINLNKMSAQDRCNMYCEENKICVLESGTIDSYRCVCDRQGYVSIGDRCLDWCAAADFSYRVLGLLEMICWSGVCKPSSSRPSHTHDFMKLDDEHAKLERESSWRPTFECDCSSSPLLVQDSESKLCKLDFQAIIKPCLPGNVGYIDCVEHKNAYCAVLHKSSWSFIRDLQKERPGTEANLKPASLVNNMKGKGDETNRGSSSKAKAKVADKLYTCVCSPEKKFLVDKPRNKERCVDECDLLNIECGRFNRMCRAATIAPDDFGKGNLVRVDPDGVRMNFKSAGCECLPGFNVGPTESIDFTVDENKPSVGPLTTNAVPGIDTYPPLSSIIEIDNLAESENLRAKYMNINSRCLLDYDVVEFHASFKAPADFDPNWIKVKQPPSDNDKPYKSFNSQIGRVETVKETSDEAVKDSNKPSSNDNHSNTIAGGMGDKDSSTIETCDKEADCLLKPPGFMTTDISSLQKNVVLVSQCDPSLAPLSIEAYRECTKYRYWIVQKLRNHFVDWRRVLTQHLSETFDLMEGNIRLKVNKCEATIRSVSNPNSEDDSKISSYNNNENSTAAKNKTVQMMPRNFKLLSPIDQLSLIDADINCELTLHSAGDESLPRYVRKVLLEKQLQKFIFVDQAKPFGQSYYLMAPNMLIRRDSFDQLAEHRKLFNPCKSDYAYCDKQTKCEMVDTVNFTCTCEYGYTPIGSRDIYYADSRKEVCEDINECLFDVCKELADASTCINEIGDYRCQCNRHYTGDNKRFCTHVCNTISCKHGKCRLVGDHHAFCECDEGYKETDCSVQDPSVALRKANMIIFGSIFTSVLLLAITIAISLNSQLKKTKKKLKRLEAVSETANLFEYPHQQPFRTRISSKVSSAS